MENEKDLLALKDEYAKTHQLLKYYEVCKKIEELAKKDIQEEKNNKRQLYIEQLESDLKNTSNLTEQGRIKAILSDLKASAI